MRNRHVRLLNAVLFAGAAGAAAGPVAGQVIIPRIGEGAVILDGRPDDPVWGSVPELPTTMFEPVHGGPIVRTTTFKVAHDGSHLYALGVFEDDGPVTANSLIRDYYAEDDLFNLVIDSFDDNETALWFLVTPRGTRIDGAITDDAEGSNWNHPELDNIWSAAAVTSKTGWSAEMRIPFSSLRFQSRGDTIRMGLIAGRLIVRLRERHTFPSIRPGPSVAQFKPSLAADVLVVGAETKRPIEIRPYMLGGISRNASSTAPQSDFVNEAGADFKAGLGSHFTLDVTLNTDFAQTEADDERLNLTRFGLYYPEKRQFFLERSGVFDIGADPGHRIFYSRTIGLGPHGRPERVYGGARLTGRFNSWDLGILDLVTERAAEPVNNSVVRVRREVLNPRSYVGGIATAVMRRGQRSVGAVGVDAAVNYLGSHFLGFAAAASVDSTGQDAGNLRLTLEDRNRRGLAYRFGATYTDAEYLPPLGFVERRGVSRIEGAVSHGSFGDRTWLQERITTISGEVLHRQGDGEIETATAAIRVDALRRGGGAGALEFRVRHEDVRHEFDLSPDVVVHAGDYTFYEGAASLSLPAGWSRRATLEISGGEFFDGFRATMAVRPAWNPSRHLELSGDFEANRLWFPDRDAGFRADIGRLRFRISPSARISLSGLAQYNSLVNKAAFNLRGRYNFEEGRDLYVVWNESLEQADTLEAPAWQQSDGTVLIKYSHPLRW